MYATLRGGTVAAMLMVGGGALAQPASAPTKAPAPMAVEKPAKTGNAPVPFTADRIREATKAGRTYRFEVGGPGEGPMTLTMRFVEVGKEKVVLESTMLDAAGKPLAEAKRQDTTWAKLESHAHYPAAATVITPEKVTVPAGTFATKKYAVTTKEPDGSTLVVQAWFADDLPGAPVKYIAEKDGKRVSTMTLLEHTNP